MEEFQKILLAAYPFSNQDLKFILDQLTLISIEKGQYLVKEREHVFNFWFVCDGFFSHYRHLGEKVVVENFNGKNTFTGDFTAFITQNPSEKNIQCLQKATLLQINYKTYFHLIATLPGFETFARKIAESLFIQAQRRVVELLTFTPEQHYHKLLEQNAQIFEKAPIQDIASYLGIKRESLSRIRKRLSEKKPS